MRGHCFAWMANVLAMAKKNSLNSECSDVRDYGAVARQSFWCPVWSPCIEPRPKIKAFDFWHPIPFSHRSTVPFCQSFRLFQWYLMEKVQQKSQTDRIVAEVDYPDCWRRRLSFTTSASEVTSFFKSLWELWLLQCFFVLRCLNLCLRLSMFVGWEGRAMSRELLRNTFVYSKCVSNYFNNSSTFFRQIA